MTQIECARAGQVTPEIEAVARAEQLESGLRSGRGGARADGDSGQ